MIKTQDEKSVSFWIKTAGFEMLPLPGHFFDMVGFRTPDDVIYLADCLSSQETLDKYQIGFIYDIDSYIKTLERIKSLNAKIFVPAHAAAAENIAPLAQYNIDKVLEIAEKITEICRELFIKSLQFPSKLPKCNIFCLLHFGSFSFF